MSTISKKICLVGDFGVGKTSLVRRFVDRSFSDQYLTSVGVKISRKLIEPSQSQAANSVQLLIWDLEGSSQFKGISATHLQGASGAIIVADVSRLETIRHLQDHIETYLTINPKGFIIVALNKIDLVDVHELAKLTEMCEFKHLDRVLGTYQTSAKMGTYVDEIFRILAYKVV
jgi:small GTP-binding protein